MLTRIPGRLVPIARSPVSREHPLAPHSASEQASPAVNSISMKLTPRQREVLAVMMQGKSNKAICRALNLAEPTVKNHVTAILKALNVTNRTEAVIKVSQASATSFTSLLSYSCTAASYSTLKQR
jgi:DNA-binding NarL/FixJ family response regulator